MADAAAHVPSTRMLNVPNLVTISRLVLSIVMFVLLAKEQFFASLVVFTIAAGTDWVDGYWARKYGQVTQLGRILDPFADKLIICGAFIFLAGAPQLASGERASGVAPWVAVVVVMRELAVTALRSFVESSGGDFSAKWAGKWKMVFQCFAAGFSMGRLWWLDPATRAWAAGPPPAWVEWGFQIALWTAIALTIYSGLDYVMVAGRALRRGRA